MSARQQRRTCGPGPRSGVYARKRTVLRPRTAQEIEELPPRHEARTNPALQVERAVVELLELPPLGKIVNRVEALFHGAEAQISGQE